ncbi:MAG: FkbM family methyltransferase [Gammaproteobacteria bacterium]|nr:FkbM family methyltransferase [Gammaproteobacteria bacterium]MDH3768311.1 FkbM family methyltransferase [Gammaproteobacteria bacterium]
MARKRPIRDLLRKVPGFSVLGKVLVLRYSPRSFLRTSGYFKSVASKRPQRVDGTPLPWMNYHMIQFLEDRLKKDFRVFEFGSGNSTLFFAPRVANITSVEVDRQWYEEVSGQMPGNANVMLCDPYDVNRYLAMLGQDNVDYDIVIVDAEDRVACLKASPPHLTSRGVILLDDADKPKYQSGIDYLLEQGFRQLPFEGLKPGGIRAYRTTVFYRDGNCLNI